MGGYYGDLIRVVKGEVGVDEDEEAGDCGREGQCRSEVGPGVRVCVDDYGKERWWELYQVVRKWQI